MSLPHHAQYLEISMHVLDSEQKITPLLTSNRALRSI